MVSALKKLLKTAKGIFFTDPKLIYKEEQHLIDKPFYFEGTNGKAVLLIHGWTSTPYEVRRLGVYLNEKGYTAYAPLLKGHGTVPKDLENVTWQDWLEGVLSAYEKLAAKSPSIYLAGTSIGANLAVMLAKDKPEIRGLVLMAMPYKIKFEKLVILFGRFLKVIKKYNKKVYPPTFGAADSITRLISYQSYPIQSSLEAYKAIAESRGHLHAVSQPCFIIQSEHDHIAKKNSLEEIFSRVSSKIKRKKYISRAYHTFISDIKNEKVFEEILNFLNEN